MRLFCNFIVHLLVGRIYYVSGILCHIFIVNKLQQRKRLRSLHIRHEPYYRVDQVPADTCQPLARVAQLWLGTRRETRIAACTCGFWVVLGGSPGVGGGGGREIPQNRHTTRSICARIPSLHGRKEPSEIFSNAWEKSHQG